MTGFAELPGRIAALTREHERVAVVLLDAFGWAFVQRHADHPLLRRLAIEPVASQFPSTTTAHLTTLYTGLPVEQHGLYEWQIYEPALDAIVLPLPFVDARTAPLPLDPRVLVPGPTFFEQLDVAVAGAAAGGDLAVDLQLGRARGRRGRAVRDASRRRRRCSAPGPA